MYKPAYRYCVNIASLRVETWSFENRLGDESGRSIGCCDFVVQGLVQNEEKPPKDASKGGF